MRFIYCFDRIVLMDEMELTIQSNGMDGEGVARYNGKVYFVDGAILGEVVVAREVKSNKNFSRAELVRIVKKSKDRCGPICKYYGICGGCNLQHIKYEEQLNIKRDNIQNLIKKSGLGANVNDVFASEKCFGYRNKVKLFVGNSNELGFNKRNSNEVITINRCELVDENFNKIIEKIGFFIKNNAKFSHFYVKCVVIRVIDNVYTITLMLNKRINFDEFEAYLKRNKINYSLSYCLTKENDIPLYPACFVGGISDVMLNEFGIKYPVFPLAFLQVNNYIKNKVYGMIVDGIEKDEIVVDAYSGSGLLSAIIAQKAKWVYAVEIEKSSVDACVELCKRNNISNLTAINGDCAELIPKLLGENYVDTIILDPARRGVDQRTIESIIKNKPRRVIYLSCNPATLVRDLKMVVDGAGYSIRYIQPFDMFPQTSEVEALVELELESL